MDEKRIYEAPEMSVTYFAEPVKLNDPSNEEITLPIEPWSEL